MERLLQDSRRVIPSPKSPGLDPLADFIETPAAQQALQRDVNEYEDVEEALFRRKRSWVSKWVRSREIDELERLKEAGQDRKVVAKYLQIAVEVRGFRIESERRAVASLMRIDGSLLNITTTPNFDLQSLELAAGDIGIAKILVTTWKEAKTQSYRGTRFHTGEFVTKQSFTLASFINARAVRTKFKP